MGELVMIMSEYYRCVGCGMVTYGHPHELGCMNMCKQNGPFEQLDGPEVLAVLRSHYEVKSCPAPNAAV